MYFKSLAENYGTCPKYIIDDIIALEQKFDFTPAKRNMIGENNLLMSGSVMQGELLSNLNFLLNYLVSQHYPILKDKVVYEKTICKPGATVDGYSFPGIRYIYRVGETLMIPLKGSATITSEEFPADATTKLEVGNIYRINTRCNAQITSSDDFIVANFTLVDFDMHKYLMPHDFYGYFPRRTDETLDYQGEPLKVIEEIDQNAY